MGDRKHTPGPWRRDRYGHVVGPDGRDVRFRSLTCAMGSHGPGDESEANTDLIAASVDMLSALMAMLAQHHGGGLLTEAHWAAARAAVQKARTGGRTE